MTGLENILSQISGDAQKEAEEQLAAARAKAEEIKNAAKAKADERSKAILQDGEKKAQEIRDRAGSAAQLARRNSMLAFKQQMIRETVENTRASLENAPDKEYFDLLLQLASRFVPEGKSEMVLSQRDLDRLPNGFEAALKKAAPKAEVAVSKTSGKIESGFLLVCGGVDVNCTFRAIFEGAEGELRDAVGRILFPEP